jgi:ABC-type multidrug transport system fused ATPase/permease subunit
VCSAKFYTDGIPQEKAAHTPADDALVPHAPHAMVHVAAAGAGAGAGAPSGAPAAPNPYEWPSAGRVVFEHVSMRYRDDLPLVLNGVDVCIEPGERVGVVGRTGAGENSD